MRLGSVRYSAVELESPVVGMEVQLMPESVEYCHRPCVEASAALAVMATALRVSPSTSEKDGLKRDLTVLPMRKELSSGTGARVGLPLAMGALFMTYDFA